MKKAIQILSLIFILTAFSNCCKRKAEKGVTITVLDENTSSPISNTQVFIHDVEHSDSGPLVDLQTTDSNGQAHLKLSTKCNDYLKIECAGNDDYYSAKYQEGKPSTRTLPKNITIHLQHK